MKNYFLILILTMGLVGCGGGGSGGSGSGSSNVTSTNNDTNNSTTSNSSSGSFKIFPYQTGRIIYQREGVIDFIDTLKIDYVGTKTFVFKDWGNTRLETIRDDQTITSINLATGAVEVKNEQEVQQEKWIGFKAYDVDYEKENITVQDFTELYNLLSDQSNQEQFTAILYPITGDVVKTGDSTVLGYSCEVYTSVTLGSEVCHHRINLALYSNLDSNIGKTTERAISAEFNIAIDDSEFSIPNYPIIE